MKSRTKDLITYLTTSGVVTHRRAFRQVASLRHSPFPIYGEEWEAEAAAEAGDVHTPWKEEQAFRFEFLLSSV